MRKFEFSDLGVNLPSDTFDTIDANLYNKYLSIKFLRNLQNH